MEIIIVAIAIIAIVVLVFQILKIADKKSKQKEQLLLMQAAGAFAESNNIRFSSKEMIGRNLMIGIDGICRKLLFVEACKETNQNKFILIDVNKIKQCAVKRIHRTIYTAGKENKKPEGFLDKIVLRFEFYDSKPAEEIPFYKCIHNSTYDAIDMQVKASQWAMTIGKMIGKKEMQRA